VLDGGVGGDLGDDLAQLLGHGAGDALDVNRL
jgi:hypothetical protein